MSTEEKAQPYPLEKLRAYVATMSKCQSLLARDIAQDALRMAESALAPLVAERDLLLNKAVEAGQAFAAGKVGEYQRRLAEVEAQAEADREALRRYETLASGIDIEGDDGTYETIRRTLAALPRVVEQREQARMQAQEDRAALRGLVAVAGPDYVLKHGTEELEAAIEAAEARLAGGPQAETPEQVVARLGIDVPAWAEEIRGKVDAAMLAHASVGDMRFGDGAERPAPSAPPVEMGSGPCDHHCEHDDCDKMRRDAAELAALRSDRALLVSVGCALVDMKEKELTAGERSTYKGQHDERRSAFFAAQAIAERGVASLKERALAIAGPGAAPTGEPKT